MSRFALGAAVVLGACVSSGPQAFSQQQTSYSGSLSKSKKSAWVRAPLTPSDALVLSPDRMQVNFAIVVELADRARALSVSKAQVAALEKARGALEAKVVPCDLRFQGTPDDDPKLIVSGRIEVPLSSELDFWARAQKRQALQSMIERLLAAQEKGELEFRLQFSAVRVLIVEPERYRAQLTERWSKRVRAFAKEVQSEGHPLHLMTCQPPQQSEQRPISFSEVALSLAVSCTLQAPRAGASATL